MKLAVFDIVCDACDHAFQEADIGPEAYGVFLLRTAAGGELRVLHAMEDRTYDEVETLLQADARIARLAARHRAAILLEVYGAAACDPDAFDRSWRIGTHGRCPSCGSGVRRSWELASPAVTLDVDVPHVTHARWDSLSPDRKLARVRSITDNLLDESTN